jgi:branched-subunit amino acid aminotransferase/4-amino-4-deoxychorismate lyase
MALGSFPANALRIMAADMGIVGRTIIYNRQAFPAIGFASACGEQLKQRSEHSEPTKQTQLIYEVLRAQRGCVLFGREHLERLKRSLTIDDTFTNAFHQPVSSTDAAFADPRLSPQESKALAMAEGAADIAAAEANAYCCGPSGSSQLLRDVAEALTRLCKDHADLEENIKIFVFLVPRDHVQPPLSPDASSTLPSPTQVRSANRGAVRWCFSFCAYFVKAFYPPKSLYEEGAYLRLLHNAHRTDPNAKIIQSTLRERAATLEQKTGCFEVLLCHDDGLVTEGARSNYFLVSAEGEVVMSADDDVLLGITRQAIEACCAEAGIPVVKRKLYVADVLAAPAIAMTGTSVGVLPVSRVDETTYASAANPVLLRVMDLYNQRARRALELGAESDTV